MTTEPRLEVLLDVPVPLVRAPEKRASLQLPPLHDATSSRIVLRPLALDSITVATGQNVQISPKPSIEKEIWLAKEVSEITGDDNKKLQSHHGVEQEKQHLPGPTPSPRESKPQKLAIDEHAPNCRQASKGEISEASTKRRKLNGTGSKRRPLAPPVEPSRLQTEAGPGEVKLAPVNDRKTSPTRKSSVLPIAALSSEAADPADSEPPSKIEQKPSRGQTGSASPGPERVGAVRPRRKWTSQETQNLLQGVAKHGVGNWKKILGDPTYSFNARSGIDLKDRCVNSSLIHRPPKSVINGNRSFRTCCPNEYRKRPKSASFTASQSSPSIMPLSSVLLTSSPPDSVTPHEPSYTPPSSSGPKRSKSPPSTSKPTSKGRSHRIRPEDLAGLGIQGPFPIAKRKERRLFTEEEDADLLKGYKAHGPQWSRIREDASLDLHSRRAVDLRDRFRNRYPDLYAKAGFKLRPEIWPKAALRSDKKDEQQAACQMESSSSSTPSSDEPSQQDQLPAEPEVSVQGLLVHDEDPTVPSISSLIDWDDNTLRPFITQNSQNSNNNSHNNPIGEMQSLLLDHIHPLLTYDPTRSLLLTSQNKTNGNNSSNHNNHYQLQLTKPAIATATTAATTVVDRRGNLNLSLESKNTPNNRSMITSVTPSLLSLSPASVMLSSADEAATKKASPPFNLPPPTDLLLPFDLDPSSVAYSSSGFVSGAAGTAGTGSTTQNPFFPTTTTTTITPSTPTTNLTINVLRNPTSTSTSALSSSAAFVVANANQYYSSRIAAESSTNMNTQRIPAAQHTSSSGLKRASTGRQPTFLPTTTTTAFTPTLTPTSTAGNNGAVQSGSGRKNTAVTTNGTASGSGTTTIGANMSTASIQQILISPSPPATTTSVSALLWGEEDMATHPMFDISTE